MEKFKVCDEIDFCLEQLQIDDHLAVAVSREYALHTRRLGKSSYYCFENLNIIYNYGLKIWMKKDFQFANELNQFVEHAVEAGLINKWLSNNEARLMYFPRGEVYKPVTLAHLTGGLLCLACVLTSAICTFIAEQLVCKKIQRGNASKFWIYTDKALNPLVQFWK